MKKLLTIVTAMSILANALPAMAEGQSSTPVAHPKSIEPVPALVWTHLDSSSDVRIERNFDSIHADWQTVCSAPCDRELPSAPDYRVAGPGIRPSANFVLRAPDGGRTVIHVNSGSKALLAIGWVVFGAGTVTTLTGFALLLGRRLLFQPGDRDDDIAGAIAIGAGASVALGGLALVLTNRRTTTSQDIFPRQPDDRPPPAGTASLWPHRERLMFPIINGRF